MFWGPGVMHLREEKNRFLEHATWDTSVLAPINNACVRSTQLAKRSCCSANCPLFATRLIVRQQLTRFRFNVAISQDCACCKTQQHCVNKHSADILLLPGKAPLHQNHQSISGECRLRKCGQKIAAHRSVGKACLGHGHGCCLAGA